MATSSAAIAPETALRGAPLLEVEEEGLRAFYSELPGANPPTREEALEFFKVNQAIFREAAIIPFRFPTLLRSAEELSNHVVDNATRYATSLQRLADLVQMEVRLTAAAAEKTQDATGADYLRGKQKGSKSIAEISKAIEHAVRDLAREWRGHEAAGGARLYGLVSRVDVGEFAKRAGSVKPAAGMKIAVTGPWPATEFI